MESTEEREHHVEQAPGTKAGFGARFNLWFNAQFGSMLAGYEKLVAVVMAHPWATVVAFIVLFCVSLLLFPLVGLAFFPQTDAGQFVVNLKAPSGTRLARHGKRSSPSRKDDSRDRVARRHGDDCVEHRRRSRIFVGLHIQCGHAHGRRPSQSEARASDWEL